MATFISNGTPITSPSPQYDIPLVSNNGVLKARHQSGLPLGYTLLDYIESTGTQYIDTGVTISGTDSVEYSTNFAVSDTSYFSQDMQVCGAYSGNRMYLFGWYQSNFIATEHSGSYDANKTAHISVSGINANVFYPVHVSIGNGNATLTVNGVSNVNTNQTTAFENNRSLFLFARNSNGNAATFAKVRLKETTIRKNGVIVIDFIPARRESDGVLGMYDTVSGNFFTNAGTGTFTAGAAVSDPVEIYTDSTVETITDNIGNVATCERLLQVGTYTDTQEILSGAVTRNVGVKVLDGTEDWSKSSSWPGTFLMSKGDAKAASGGICTHFIWNSQPTSNGVFAIGSMYNFRVDSIGTVTDFKQFLADQYNAGTPVIIIYPLATPTTESVAGQTLQVTDGDNTLEITQAALSNLELEAQYQAAVSLTIQEVQDANLDPNVEVTIN